MIGIGGRSPAAPATPPCVRVRTRRFEIVNLTRLRTVSTCPCWPGFRVHSIAENDSISLPLPPAGLHPRRRSGSPVSLDFCRLSLLRSMSYLPLLSFGPSATVSGSAYLLLRLSALECLTSLADVMTYYALC